MKIDDYQRKLALSLISKFTRDFNDKTGLNVNIHVPEFVKFENDNLKYMLTLPRVEQIFLQCIPVELKPEVQLSCRSRKRHIVDLRTMFCSIAYRLNFTLSDIGRYINRDHTTIIYLTRKADDLLETDEHFASLYNSITYQMSKHYDEDF
jgi:hypothetical protein